MTEWPLADNLMSEDSHVFDAIRVAEKSGAPVVLAFRRAHLHPEAKCDDEACHSYTIAQIRTDVLSSFVDVPLKDALTLVALQFLLSGALPERLSDLSLASELPTALYERNEKLAMISDLREIFDALFAEHLSSPELRNRFIKVAQGWPLYFGHVFKAKQLDGTPLSKTTTEHYFLVNVLGLEAFRMSEGGRRVILGTFTYNEITDLVTKGDILTVSVAGRASSFECDASTIKTLINEYMVHLMSQATVCVAVSDHQVSDADLLSFTKGSLIHIIREGESSDGWGKGEFNGQVGQFPWNRVAPLVGQTQPSTKEALAFQILLRSSSHLSRSELMSVLDPSRPSHAQRGSDSSMGSFASDSSSAKALPPISEAEVAPPAAAGPAALDERFNFYEYARKYFAVPKRSKGTLTSRILGRNGTLRGKRGSIMMSASGTLRAVDPQAIIALSTSKLDAKIGPDEILPEEVCFSAEALTKPLLRATEGKKHAKLALSLNQAILRCMGDYPSKRDWKEHAGAIIEESIETPELRDEMFAQIIRQLINNRRRDSCERGWWLLSLAVGCVFPSPTLQPFLHQFLLQTAARTPVYKEVALSCAARLDRTRGNGMRRHPPIQAEFDGVTSNILLAIKVYFPDDSSRSFAVDSGTLAGELIRKIVKKLDSEMHYFQGCALYLVADAYQICIPHKMHLFDAMSEAAMTPQTCKVYFKKKIWLGTEGTSSDPLNNLLYYQFLPGYLHGMVSCNSPSTEERLKQVTYLAALQYKANGDDQRKSSSHSYALCVFYVFFTYVLLPATSSRRIFLQRSTAFARRTSGPRPSCRRTRQRLAARRRRRPRRSASSS